MYRIIFIPISLLLLAVACVSSKTPVTEKIAAGKVEFICVPMAGDKPFYLDSLYVSPAGELFSINNLKFFMSDIAFSRSNTTERAAHSDTAAHGVFLVDLSEAKPDKSTGFLYAATYFTMQAGDYSDIRFNIGVPRALNHSDPTQAPYPLDVGNTDMFWEWNSGYIFFLAEGKSSAAEDSIVHLAVGGDARIMPVGFGDIFNAVPLIQVKENAVTRIYFKLNINAFFKNPDGTVYSFKPAEASVVHNSRYADMLRLNILQSLEFISAECMELK
jgi:hypothetical protein